MKKATAVVSVALMAVSLTACGGGSDDKESANSAYCDQAKAFKKMFASLPTDGGPEKLGSAAADLAKDAPEIAQPHWEAFSTYFAAVTKALDTAGLPATTLSQTLDPKHPPPGVTAAEITAYGQATQQALADPALANAQPGLEVEIAEDCSFSLFSTAPPTTSETPAPESSSPAPDASSARPPSAPPPSSTAPSSTAPPSTAPGSEATPPPPPS